MNELSFPRPQEITKADIEELFKPLVASVFEGGTKAIDAHIYLTINEKASVFAKDKIEKILIEEVSRYKEGYSARGVTLIVSHTGDRLDYSSDPIVKDLEAKLEARKELLKAVTKSGMAVADIESGVIAEPLEIKTVSHENVKTTIKV